MINKIFIIFVLFTVTCIQPNNKPKIKDGAIFGKVAFYNAKNIKPFKITLMETNKIIQPDDEGYFYINNLKPGIYNIKIQAEGLIDHSAEQIEVLYSKITCLQPFYIDRLDTVKEKIEWDLLEYQKKIEPIKYGKIEGYIVDMNGRPVKNALVSYNDNKYLYLWNGKSGKCLWEGKSDSKGYFKINKVVPGNYPEISVHGWMTKAVNVVVRPNRITRVKPAIILGALTSNKIHLTLLRAYNQKYGYKFSMNKDKSGGRLHIMLHLSPEIAEAWGINLSQADPEISARIEYKGDISFLPKQGITIGSTYGQRAHLIFPLSKLPILNSMDEILNIGTSPLGQPNLN